MSIADKLKKLEQILADAEKTRLWGNVELQFNDGELAVIRETKTTKLTTRRGFSRDEKNSSY